MKVMKLYSLNVSLNLDLVFLDSEPDLALILTNSASHNLKKITHQEVRQSSPFTRHNGIVTST